MAVVIDSGPVEAEDLLRHVPREKWRSLMLARRSFLEVKLSYDCRCLVQFVADADQMFQVLGFASARDMIRDGYGLEPEEIDVAVEWLRLNPPKEPLPLDRAAELGRAAQALEGQTPALKAVGQHGKGSDKENVTTFHGNRGSSYAIARLRRDRPDILARVLKGELSPHAGMIEAGFRKKIARKKLSALQRAAKAVAKLTLKEWKDLKRDEDARRRPARRRPTSSRQKHRQLSLV